MMGTLTSRQIDEFERRGFLRLEGLLAPEKSRRALEHVRRGLASVGLWKNGTWHLDAMPKPKYPESGPSASKTIGNKHPDLQALVDDPAVGAAVDCLLQGAAVDHKWSGTPQILVTLPNADEWSVPTSWHVDYPRLASGRSPGVGLFTFLDIVQPQGGGTLVVPGTHGLLNDGRFVRSKEVSKRLKQAGQEIVEMTGARGDVYFTDLRLLHTAAPNTAQQPRIMLAHRFVRADVVEELSNGFWGGE